MRAQRTAIACESLGLCSRCSLGPLRGHMVPCTLHRRVVLAKCGLARDGELLHVELAHGFEVELAGFAASLKEGQLQRLGPGEGQVPRARALGLVDGREAGCGVLQGLATREEVGALHGAGEDTAEHVDIGLADFRGGVVRGAVLTRVDHVGLERRSLHVDAVVNHRFVEHGLHLHVDAHGGLEIVVPHERNVGLHDGHEALGLADERVPREVLHVGLNGKGRDLAIPDLERRAPLGEAGARSAVLLAARSEGVEALHDCLPAAPGERVHLEVGLHAGHNAAV
mmetsp:Transcript_19576/g.48034  ORF Transcript_19576/g.48034 Transcript_19576/m.48034 type:complete len:283 (-) Transcript_19576:284-1132(-)